MTADREIDLAVKDLHTCVDRYLHKGYSNQALQSICDVSIVIRCLFINIRSMYKNHFMRKTILVNAISDFPDGYPVYDRCPALAGLSDLESSAYPVY